MSKLKIGVIFGGQSTEHEVSIVSGMSVIKNLNKEKYDIEAIYIEENGIWNYCNINIDNIQSLKVGDKISDFTPIPNVIEYLKTIEVAFPVLHGKDGEDGSIQGLFELTNTKYVGCKILSSSVAMDKVYMKNVFEKASLNQTKYIYVKKVEDKYIYVDNNYNESYMNEEAIANLIDEKLIYPVFVKPSNSGSSVGITKVGVKKDIIKAIENASIYDYKVIIEQGISGKEVECSVIGNEEVEASCVGEIIPGDEFYSFDDKYKNGVSKQEIPANISKDLSDEIRRQAIKAFKAIDGKGLSRVDFFIEQDTNRIVINEINTLPGFTEISMYSKLWEKSGKKYPEILEQLINLA